MSVRGYLIGVLFFAALVAGNAVSSFAQQTQRSSVRQPLAQPVRAEANTDFWTEENLGRHAGEFAVDQMPPHSARLLVCK